MLVIGLLLVVMFRLRYLGFYFHFKLLTFLGPIVVLIAIVGFARMRRVGVGLALGLMLMVNAVQGALAEEKQTSNQLPRQIIVLGQLSRELPRSASIRLDMNPPFQLWVAYFLHPHPLCSQRPLLNQSYPHVLISRRG